MHKARPILCLLLVAMGPMLPSRIGALSPSSAVAPAKRMTGETVLGRHLDYVKLSEKLGARRFEVPMQHWNSMTRAEQCAANQKFLDRTILGGDTIRLASPPSR